MTNPDEFWSFSGYTKHLIYISAGNYEGGSDHVVCGLCLEEMESKGNSPEYIEQVSADQPCSNPNCKGSQHG